MAAIIKLLSTDLPTESLVFFRNFFVVLILLPWILRHDTTKINSQQFRFHLVRSLSGVGAMYCFFYIYAHLPLADAVLFRMTVPFFIPIICAWWLGEAVPMQIRWSILIGFFGVVVILKLGMVTFSPVVLIALMGSLLAALAKSAIRRMSDTEASIHIVFYFSFISMLVSVVPLWWAWVTPTWQEYGLLLLIAILATVGQLLMTQAFQRAPAAQIGPFGYVSVIFAALYGWLFWNEVIDLWFFSGGGLIIVAGFLIIQNQKTDKINVKD